MILLSGAVQTDTKDCRKINALIPESYTRTVRECSRRKRRFTEFIIFEQKMINSFSSA